MSNIEESDIIFNFTQKYFQKNINIEKNMIDVGAASGRACVPFALKGWKVYAFEPNLHFYNHKGTLLKKYILSGKKNITLENYAVSEKNDHKIPFYISDESRGISSITKWHTTHKKASFYVNTIRLDYYMKLKNINKVNFLKIDTEGQDLFVLKSYNWEKYKPEIILCEYEDKKTKIALNYTWKDMCKYLNDKGYNIVISEWYPLKKYGSGGNHKFRCFNKYPCSLQDENSWGNFICFKDLKLFKIFCNLHKDKFI
tara:strand:+ start:197 stop:964 length:768 start_codon:yes stop_codon:yes gene_type:complete